MLATRLDLRVPDSVHNKRDFLEFSLVGAVPEKKFAWQAGASSHKHAHVHTIIHTSGQTSAVTEFWVYIREAHGSIVDRATVAVLLGLPRRIPSNR